MSKKFKSVARAKKLRLEPRITSTSILSQINHPVFCLHYLEPKYCLTKCSQPERASFADTIRILSQFPWTEIIAKKISGFEKIINKKSIKGKLPSIINEDESIIGFHFHGRQPMLGIRRDCIFHIMWFDPRFELYDHG